VQLSAHSVWGDHRPASPKPQPRDQATGMHRLLALTVSLVASSSFAGKPVMVGKGVTEGGVKVSLLSVRPMNESELKGAAGGRVIQWTLEPQDGVAQPALGDVKLFLDGKLYNPVVNATSSKPLAPDLIIEDARKLGFGAGDPLAGTVLSPKAAIITVLIRGAALAPDAAVETSIELGLWKTGVTPKAGMKPRYVEFRAKSP
jgi:hypothetical protein